jgi:hypothetical protein
MTLSDMFIPTTDSLVRTDDQVINRTITISNNPTNLLSDFIRYSSLRSINGLLTATKPLTIQQIHDLQLLGLSLYCQSMEEILVGREDSQTQKPYATLQEDKRRLERQLSLAHNDPLVGAYNSSTASSYIMAFLRS